MSFFVKFSPRCECYSRKINVIIACNWKRLWQMETNYYWSNGSSAFEWQGLGITSLDICGEGPRLLVMYEPWPLVRALFWELPSFDVGRWMSDQVKKLHSLDFGWDAINILERKFITTALGYKNKSVYDVYVETWQLYTGIFETKKRSIMFVFH